jgi:Raf kinase inhibitor-like YbhB/YbcL family protein
MLQSQEKRTRPRRIVTIDLMSPAFRPGERMPVRFTADGQGFSPPLRWANPPAQTRSLAIACDDPDAPSGVLVHWVACNIASDRRHLREAASASSDGIREGTNDFGRRGYLGPNPPRGESHRYAFRIYALDVYLDLASSATRVELDIAMAGHVVAEGMLIGRYEH